MRICCKCQVEYEIICQTEFFDIYECPKCNKQRIFNIDDCCRTPFKIVIIDKTKKNERLFFQCIHCGGIVNKNSPLPFKKYGEEIRDELNECRFNEWEDRKNREYLLVKKVVDENNFFNSKRGVYLNYLNSSEWKAIKKMVLKRDEYLCQECKENQASEVHHLTYKNIYNEKLEELISVCSDCHKKIHNELMQKQIKKF